MEIKFNHVLYTCGQRRMQHYLCRRVTECGNSGNASDVICEDSSSEKAAVSRSSAGREAAESMHDHKKHGFEMLGGGHLQTQCLNSYGGS